MTAFVKLYRFLCFPKNQKTKLIILSLGLLFFNYSCNNSKEAPPFPTLENEYEQPKTKSFEFSKPDTLKWITKKPSEIKKLPSKKFSWDKLPSGQGTGLGLSLSYDIIKAHGGELLVDTKEGEGTTFNIVIPIDNKK